MGGAGRCSSGRCRERAGRAGRALRGACGDGGGAARAQIDVGREDDPLKIATMELRAGKVPFIIRRTLPNGTHEDWAVNELVIEHTSLSDRYG